jgi:hypothetical protein
MRCIGAGQGRNSVRSVAVGKVDGLYEWQEQGKGRRKQPTSLEAKGAAGHKSRIDGAGCDTSLRDVIT